MEDAARQAAPAGMCTAVTPIERPRRDGCIPPPQALAELDRPLEYIFVDHHRHRAACMALRGFADLRQAERAEADQMIAFLSADMPLHHEDEEADLYPALRRRAEPTDELGPVLARLIQDHRNGERMADSVVDALGSRLAEDPVRIGLATVELIQAYAALEDRHLAIENAVVLVIARIRLKRVDLRAVSRGMKARRGVVVR